jgi:uncharacterized protein (DUF927 family)
VNEGFTPFGDIEALEKDDLLFNEDIFKYIFGIESHILREKTIARLQVRAKELKVSTQFNRILKAYDEEQKKEYIYDGNFLTFDGLDGENNVFKTNRYELMPTGEIYEVVPNIGKFLVCYHPIVPIEKYRNFESGTEKIKLAYYVNNNWNYIIVEKSTIASPQSIIKLADVGISVTSETAKYLIKYLSEIENLNKDKITMSTSVSRLGWIDKKIIPYNNDYEFDNEASFPRVKERFGEAGTLKEWADFFRERRKYNDISRIIMAGAVTSILLEKLNASGFTIHVWGESEYGKTVACMAGQSIFGNPSQSDNKGIGINFNFTNAGLEYRLNLYNNIPLFINEMQLQKEAKDYDKMLFMIETGKGKARATKFGGIGQETTWDLVAITNGEKNIVKANSDNGAYNRCISCELTEYSFEDLSEVADFSKEHYGTAIREILNHLDEYDVKAIFKEKRDYIRKEETEITEKQKILEALIMTGDKILTDIIFKDNFYLTVENFKKKTVNKEEIAIEERAYETVRSWYISKKRCFLGNDNNEDENEFKNKNIDIYGKILIGELEGYVAFMAKNLREVLNDNGFDFEQITKSWARKGYTKCDKGKNQKNVRINGVISKCVVLNMNLNSEIEEEIIPIPYSLMEEDMILPF